MHRISKLLVARGSWLVACGALSLSVDANAAVLSQARAVVRSPTYTIYDATPSDGVAASAYFLDPAQAWRSQAYISVTNYVDDELGFDEHLSYSPAGPTVLSSAQSAALWPAAGLGGAGGAYISTVGQVGAQGQSLAAGIGYSAFGGLSTTASGIISPTFYNLILGPGTGVTITAEGTAEVWLSHQGEYASAYTQLYATFSPRAADGSYQSVLRKNVYDNRSAWLDATSPELGWLPPGTGLAYQQQQGLMQVTYENLSDAEQIGRVRFSASADGLSLPAANVPEPQSAWMLLAGLACLAFAGKRLRQ